MKTRNIKGPSTNPQGTFGVTKDYSENVPLEAIPWSRRHKKLLTQASRLLFLDI